MSHVLRIGVVDQIAYFRAFDTDGSGKTDLVFDTTGLALTVFRIGLAEVSIASLSAKAADNTAHADGAIRQVAGNLYTVDLPDAATATQTPSVGVKGSYTGGVIEPVPHPIVNYDPSLVAVGANTEASKAFTFGSGPTIQIADTAKRQITWPTASETITGTIQWDGQVSKAITGAITFRETISGNHFYDWAYNAADRPPVPGYAVIQFTDGVFTDDPLVVGFVSAPTVSAFEARTLPSADYFVEGDYTEPPTVANIQNGLATEAKQDTAKTAIDAILLDTDATIPGLIAAVEVPTLTGPWTRTVTVTDSVSGDPIQNATVRFFRTGETESKATDASGVASFTVEAATWSYAIVASGYAGASGTVVVSESGDTAVTLVANAAPPIVTTETTALTFRVSSQGNASLAGVVASARLIGEGYKVTGSTVGINIVETATSDAGGLVTLILFRESDYDLSVQRTNGTIYKIRIRTSATGSTTISTAIEV